MTDLTLTPLGLFSGVWKARLSTRAEVDVTLRGEPVEASLEPAGEGAVLAVPVPVEALSDGVQTILVTDRADGTRLGHFSIVAGEVLEADVRAELDLLRAELEMVKRALRRQARGG